MNKALATLSRLARENFAAYLLEDTYGTRRFCWTEREAMEWLPACAPTAQIRCLGLGYGGRVIAAREYVKA